jgi:ABC-type amino acid transport substrate-binding protein/PAS domain-containing protein
MHRLLAYCFISIILQIAAPGDLYAADDELNLTVEEKAWLDQHPIISLGVDPSFPPFEFIGKGGNYLGMASDYLKIISERLGVEMKVIPGLTWTQVLEKAKNREIDALPAVGHTDERSVYLNFSQSYMTFPVTFWTRKDHKPVNGFEDLSGKKLAMVQGYYYVEQIAKKNLGIQPYFVKSPLEALKALSTGKVDAFIGNLAVATYLIQKNDMFNLRLDSPADLSFSGLSFGIRKDWPEFVTILDKAIDSISQEQHKKIQKIWLPAAKVENTVSTNVKLTVEEKKWLEAHPKIRVHNETNWPPFNFAQGGQAKGFSIDFMNLLAQKVGMEVEYVTGPTWDQFLELMKSGDLDVMLNIAKTPERLKYLLYTPPYASNPNTILSKRGNTYKSIEQLFGKTVALPKGFFYEEILKRDYPKIKLLLVKNILEGMKAVNFGNADAALGELAVFHHLISDHTMTDLVVSGDLDLGDPELTLLNIATRSDLPILASILTKGMNSITKEEKQEIRRKWFGRNETPVSTSSTETSRTALILMSSILGLLVLFTIAGLVLQRMTRGRDISLFFGAPGFKIGVMAGLSLLVAVVIIMNWLVLADSKKRTTASIKDELQIVLHSSIERLNTWVSQREAFLVQLGRNPELVKISKNLLMVDRENNDLSKSLALADARKFFASNEQFGPAGFFIISRDRINIGSRRNTNLGMRNFIADKKPDLIEKAFKGDAVFIPPIRSDLNISIDNADSSEKNPLTMFFAAPIVDEDGTILAVLTERILPSGSLSKILQYSQVRKSGDTYAFNSEAIMITDSRFKKGLVKLGLIDPQLEKLAELEIRDPGGDLTKGYQPGDSPNDRPVTQMISNALKLKKGMRAASRSHHDHPTNTDGYRDYRGAEVIGTWTWMHKLDLGLATEVDLDEAMAGHFTLRIALIGISTIAMLLAIGATLFTLILGQRAHTSLRKARDELENRVAERTEKIERTQETLHVALDNMAGGIILVDKNFTLQLFNKQFLEIYDIPSEVVQVGKSVKDVFRIRAKRGEYGPGDADELVEQRVQSYLLYDDSASTEEFIPTTGMTVEVFRTPLDSGGMVAVFNDITDRKTAQATIEKDYGVMTDSIRYASRIQRSLLPKDEVLRELFSDHLVIWEPRDVVGGDLYWIKKDRNGYFFVLFDCTGHGVPGALMTIITTSALNVAFTETNDPARLVARVNQIIKDALDQQKGDVGDSDDGVEMGVCLVEPDRMRATFAGAKFDLILSEGTDFKIIKGDKSSIGYRHVDFDRKFTNHNIRLRPGQRFYLYTDGITDQVGGEKRRSFGRKRLMELLKNVSHLPLTNQETHLKHAFEEFQGSESRRDDFSLIGIMPLH